MTDTTDLKARLRAQAPDPTNSSINQMTAEAIMLHAADALDAKDRTIAVLEAEVERLESLVHVPGVWRCACHKWCHERAAEALEALKSHP